MDIYLIDGREKIGKTEFSSLLGNKLSKDKKTLIIGTKRSEGLNIEDFYKKDGMITYDICDYFLGYADIETIINKANDKLDFIISPLVNGKFEIKKDDIKKLMENLSYDYLIFDGLDPEMVEEKTTIKIIDQNDLDNPINSDFFFINKAKEDFDPRLAKDQIEGQASKYLGYVNENGSFNNILDNLLKEKEEPVGKLGFFEKLKMKFKWKSHIFL